MLLRKFQFSNSVSHFLPRPLGTYCRQLPKPRQDKTEDSGRLFGSGGTVEPLAARARNHGSLTASR